MSTKKINVNNSIFLIVPFGNRKKVKRYRIIRIKGKWLNDKGLAYICDKNEFKNLKKFTVENEINFNNLKFFNNKILTIWR